MFTVHKPENSSLKDVNALISFGVDPTSPTEKSKGVGIYSNHYCFAKNTL